MEYKPDNGYKTKWKPNKIYIERIKQHSISKLHQKPSGTEGHFSPISRQRSKHMQLNEKIREREWVIIYLN